jgi:hypothetical protein
MIRSRWISLRVFIPLGMVLSGCALPLVPEPTSTPTATAAPMRTATPTQTHTPSPTQAPLCDADQTIMDLRGHFPDDDAVFLHHTVEGVSTLVVWYVDGEVRPSVEEAEITANRRLAMQNGMEFMISVRNSDPCIAALFQEISLAVVDPEYNAWFMVQADPNGIPQDMDDEAAMAAWAVTSVPSYLRETATASHGAPAAGSCSWEEARAAAHGHFDPARRNVDFYLIQDEYGVSVWTQWDGDPEYLMANIFASVLNIGMEMECLFPVPDRIILQVVDGEGEMLFMGFWNWEDARQQDVGKIYVVYQQEE